MPYKRKKDGGKLYSKPRDKYLGMPRKLELVIPDRIWRKLEECQARTGVRIEDLIMRAILKVIEEFSK